MGIHTAYTSSAKLPLEAKQKADGESKPQTITPTVDNPILINQVFEWKTHPQTQKLMSELHKECDELVNKAISAAIAYAVTKNHEIVIQHLTKVDALRKKIEDYVK